MSPHPIDHQVPRLSRRLLTVVGGGFFLILLTLVAVGLALHQSVRIIQRNVELVADVEEPESAATYEMEINVLEAGLAVKKYLLEGDAAELDRLSGDEADFVRFLAEYERLGDDTERNLAREIAAISQRYRDIGHNLLRLGQDRVALHAQLAADVEQIDYFFVAMEFARTEGKPLEREALSLQADIGELGTWLGVYLTDPREPHRQQILDDVDHVRNHLARLQEIPMESDEQGLIDGVTAVIERIADGAFRILTVGDTLREQLAEYGRVRKEMDALLDDRIQARTRTELRTSHENVHANLRRLLWMSLLLIGIAALVVSGAAIAIYRQSVRLSDISVDELKAAFSRLSASERLRGALLRRVVSAQEVERGRIARDLHDQMSQNLSALSLGLASIQRTSNRTLDNLHSVESLQVIAQRLADDLHFVAWNLRPAALDDLGLHGAISSLVETWNSRTGLVVDFYSEMDGYRLSEEIETTLYRVAQEALTNTTKHAGAHSVSIVLKRFYDHVRLVVEDNGSGFDTNVLMMQKGPEGRLGLMGMKERVENAGGSLEIDSTPGYGTTIVASVPVEATIQERLVT